MRLRMDECGFQHFKKPENLTPRGEVFLEIFQKRENLMSLFYSENFDLCVFCRSFIYRFRFKVALVQTTVAETSENLTAQ